MRWAALLHDIGKPKSFRTTDEGITKFKGHDSVGADMAFDILGRFGFDNDDREEIVFYVRNHMVDYFEDEKNAKKFVEKMGGRERAQNMLILCMGDAENKPDQKKDQAGILQMTELIKSI